MNSNKELFEDGQQASFMHGDPDFMEAVSSAYSDVYTYDMYCARMRNPVGVKANCEWGDGLTLGAAKDIWSVNILVHSISPQAGYRAIYVDGCNDEWETLHLAHFQSRPQHYAAIRCYSPSDVAAVAEDDKFTFGGYSPELAARVRDELDELAVSMCTSCML